MSRLQDARAHDHEEVMGDDTISLTSPYSIQESDGPVSHHDAVPQEILTLGIDEQARAKLEQLSGTQPTLCWLPTDEKGYWRDEADIRRLARRRPMYITTTWHAPDPDNVDAIPEAMLHLASGLWLDIDARKSLGETIADAIAALDIVVSQLQALDIDLHCCSLFASGGKGFHVYVPLDLLVPGGVDKVGIITARFFQRVSRAFVKTNLFTNQTDLNIYSGGRGRLFRQPGVQRSNGAYKVPLAWREREGMTVARYNELCSAPRSLIASTPVEKVASGAAQAWKCACKEVGKAAAPPKVLAKRSKYTDFHGRLFPAIRERIDEALALLPVDLEYGAWLKVGMALKSTGAVEGFDIWVEMSKRSKKYREGECEDRWDGFTGGVTLGTLFHLSKTGGVL